MVNTDKACDRCGLVVDYTELLDLDTGSCCHPEPIQCIHALRARVREAEERVALAERNFQAIWNEGESLAGAVDRYQKMCAKVRWLEIEKETWRNGALAACERIKMLQEWQRRAVAVFGADGDYEGALDDLLSEAQNAKADNA